jgi:hypothetical protein
LSKAVNWENTEKYQLNAHFFIGTKTRRVS